MKDGNLTKRSPWNPGRLISKTRELRARLAARHGRRPTDKQRARLGHYGASLRALQQAAPRLRLVEVLALELWSLHTLPPARR